VQRLEGIQPIPFEYGRGVVLESQLLQDLKGCAMLNMGKYDNASDVLANVASYVSFLVRLFFNFLIFCIFLWCLVDS
jgi:hypothetical protein